MPAEQIPRVPNQSSLMAEFVDGPEQFLYCMCSLYIITREKPDKQPGDRNVVNAHGFSFVFINLY